MYKLIVFDIDGTLRDEVKGIPNSTIQAIKQCVENNYQICICTGRNLKSIPDDIYRLPYHHIISGGGNYINAYGIIVKDIAFPNQVLLKLLNEIKTYEIALSIESNHHIYMNELAASIYRTINFEKGLSKDRDSVSIKNEKIIYQDNIGQYKSEQDRIHKLCIWVLSKYNVQIEMLLTSNWFEIVQKDKYKQYTYYEVVNKDSHKGNAIENLSKYLNINKNEILAFGDGLNDIDMFNACGTTIAMKNSCLPLKEIASKVCGDVLEDGIYKELVDRKMIKGEEIC